MPPKVKTAPVEAKTESRRYPLFEISRKVLLASVGAVALAQDEIEEFIHRLVERGEIAEKDGRKLMQEILSQRKETREKIKQKTGQRLKEVFSRLDLPSRQDIEQLHQKIAELTQKVDELKRG